jgi:hypothetical protein
LPFANSACGWKPRHDFALFEAAAQVGQVDEDRFVDRVGLQALFVAREHRFEFLDAQRLLDASEHVQAVGARHHLHGVQQRRIQRTDQRDAARQPPLRDVADELDAVHAGHVEVDEHDVGAAAAVLRGARGAAPVGASCTWPMPSSASNLSASLRWNPWSSTTMTRSAAKLIGTIPRKVHASCVRPRIERVGGAGAAANRRRCYNPASFSTVLPRLCAAARLRASP